MPPNTLLVVLCVNYDKYRHKIVIDFVDLNLLIFRKRRLLSGPSSALCWLRRKCG